MRPSLTVNGLLTVGAGGTFVIAGALLSAWPLVGLGSLILSVPLVLFVLFVPQAAMFRRRRLEFAWWFPAAEMPAGAVSANHPVPLHILFRNRSPSDVPSADVEFLHSPALEVHSGLTGPLQISLPASSEIRFRLETRPKAAGRWFLQGLVLKMSDRFGLFSMTAYFPNLLDINVFPPYSAHRARLAFRPQAGSAQEHSGPRLLRRRGLGTDLREIREHRPGDPFKRIAWKATARTRKLMVREHDSEILVTRQIVVDVSPSMRRGSIGAQRLDTAIALCGALGRAAVDEGDRFGLITFDTRVHDQVPPGDGPPQLSRVLEHLIELHSPIDDDQTEITDSELFSAVADYLAYQHGIDSRLQTAPDSGDPRWDEIVIGTHGELIDVPTLQGAVKQTLDLRSKNRRKQPGQIRAATEDLKQLRYFCRSYGIELPYRRPLSVAASKEDGFAEAIALAAQSRSSRQIVLVSDLLGIEHPDAVMASLALARRRRHHLIIIIPHRVVPSDELDAAEEFVDIRQRKALRRSIEELGIPVIEGTDRDAVHTALLISKGGVGAGPARPAQGAS